MTQLVISTYNMKELRSSRDKFCIQNILNFRLLFYAFSLGILYSSELFNFPMISQYLYPYCDRWVVLYKILYTIYMILFKVTEPGV